MNWAEVVTTVLREVLLVLLLALSSWGVPKLIWLYTRVTKAKVSTEATFAAAAYADELARKFARGLVPSGPSTPAEKLAVASKYLQDFFPNLVKGMTDEDRKRLIESAVNLLRRQSIPPLQPVPPTTPEGVPPPLPESLRPPP